MINALQSKLEEYSGELLSLLRIFAGYTFMLHGTQKLFSFPIEPSMTVELVSMIGLAGLIESIGGLLLLIGLFTRPVAFLCSGMMGVAYWIAHAPSGNFLWPLDNDGDAAVLFCFAFLYIAAVGGGKWSVDSARQGS